MLDDSNTSEYAEAANQRRIARRESSRGGEREYLTLKVVRPSQEQEGMEIHFRVKPSTCMGKLKRSYSDKIGVQMARYYQTTNK